MTLRIFVFSVAAILLACESDPTTVPARTATDPAGPGTGTITVRLEPVNGRFFMEGFEIGLRFETGDGKTIDSMLWSEFVNAKSSPTLDDYYTSVLVQEVNAGTVVVFASVNLGIGPPPQIPDVQGKLRCRLKLQVPEGGTVDVEVTFSDTGCLRLLKS